MHLNEETFEADTEGLYWQQLIQINNSLWVQ